MAFSLNTFSITLFISAIVSAGVAVSAYQRRHVYGAKAMMAILILLTLWSFSYSLENLSPSLGWHKFWAAVHYPAIAFVPVVWLVFAIQYTFQQDAPSWKKLALLGIVPAITVLMAWTNDLHSLMWTERTMIELQGGIVVMRSVRGPYFTLHAIYSYVAIFAGIFFLLRHVVKTSRAYQSQAAILLTAVLIFISGNLLVILDLLPFKGVDITPFSFTVSSLILSYGLFRHQLFDLMPVASEMILQNIGDGVLVLDANKRIVFINPAFERLAGLLPETSVGASANEVFFNWPNVFRNPEKTEQVEAKVTLGDRDYFLQIEASPIWHRNVLQGGIYVVHDITEKASQQERMRMFLESRERVSEDFIFMALDQTNTTILDVNGAFSLATGYAPEEVLGKSILSLNLVSIETRALLNRILRTSPGVYDMSITVRAKNRQEQEWNLSISTISLNDASFKIWLAQIVKH
jgi:PAS domain S-box-containing protein